MNEFIQDVVWAVNNKLKTSVRWMKCRLYHRHHLVDIRDHRWYKWGWIDADIRLLLSSFKILVNFVEKEKPFENTDYSWSDDSKARGDEIHALYNWWKIERKEDHDRLDAMLENIDKLDKKQRVEAYKAAGEFEQSLYEKDTEMLVRLMKIRGSLWT